VALTTGYGTAFPPAKAMLYDRIERPPGEAEIIRQVRERAEQRKRQLSMLRGGARKR
jgi:hypothetical protein